MSDDQAGSKPPPGQDVGSVGEEAAKLFGALSGWASEHVGEAQETDVPEAAPDPAAAAHGLADAFGDILDNVSGHIATGGEDCRYCPVCQVIHAVRETSPEVRHQLSIAASSLIRAAAGLLATESPGPKAPGVQKIDLNDDTAWGDER